MTAGEESTPMLKLVYDANGFTGRDTISKLSRKER
jgi:hypothetical protein